MRLLFTLLLCGVIPGLAAPSARPTFQGHWDGVMNIAGEEVPIFFDLERNAQGVWRGSFEIPSRNVMLLMSDISADTPKLKFRLPELHSPLAIEGAIRADGALLMTVANTQGKQSPALANRTGAAKVKRDVPGPAVAAKYEGDFEGNLPGAGGSVLTVMHIHNESDKTVKVTFDSPTNRLIGVRACEVSMEDGKLSARMRVYGSTFVGKFSDDARTITGEWTAYGTPMGLKLTRIAPKKAAPKK